MDDELRGFVERFQGGDPKGFEELYRITSGGLFGQALRYLGEPGSAQEVVQEVFMALIEGIEDFEPRGSVRGYLLNAVRFRALDRLKHTRVRERAAGEIRELSLVEPTSPLASAEARQEADQLNRALEDLPDEQRVVVYLKAFADLTFAEIAETEQIPLGTALSRYRAGLAKLRTSLGESAR